MNEQKDLHDFDRFPPAIHDVFISYRRRGGLDLAARVKDALERRGFSAFMDIEDLKSGPFNEALLRKIEDATDVVVILTPGCLKRCKNEDDWLRREIRHAIEKDRNVVPIMAHGFKMPIAAALPSDIAKLPDYNGLTPAQELFEASIDRLVLKYLMAAKKDPATVAATNAGAASATEPILPQEISAWHLNEIKSVIKLFSDLNLFKTVIEDGALIVRCEPFFFRVVQDPDCAQFPYSVIRKDSTGAMSYVGSWQVIKQRFTTWISDIIAVAEKCGDVTASASANPNCRTTESDTGGQRFTRFFAERPDVIADVEAEAFGAPENIVAEFERQLLRLEVCVREPFARDYDPPNGEQNLDRILCQIEKRDSDNDAGKAFVSVSRQPNVPYKEWYDRLQQYQRAIGAIPRIREAIVAMGTPALPLVCVAFRQMNSCDGHNALRSGFNYTGWIESELLQVMRRLRDFRALPFIADAVLRHADQMDGHNDYALAIVRVVQAFGADSNTVDACFERLIGTSASEILREKRDRERH